ncbi:MAG: hypothetical protein M1339_08780 [Bacteroidetes bacterium]|nr:hypothetical protein [Bacteroidota bacterium]
MRTVFSLSLCILLAGWASSTLLAQTRQLPWMEKAITATKLEMDPGLDSSQRERLNRGLKQVASFWRAEDGDEESFKTFVKTNFAADQTTLDAMFARFERLNEQLSGHMVEIIRELRTQTDLDQGKIYPFDAVFAAYDPSAHIQDDLFANKLAFTVLLNFPITTLDERVNNAGAWSRRQWAEARLALGFTRRVPADVNLALSRAAAEAEQYVAGYNIWMDCLVDGSGERIFPEGMRLLSHWNLRDEIKADYADPSRGLEKQRMIECVMERIVTQSIPAAVIDNPGVNSNPFTNQVSASRGRSDGNAAITRLKVSGDREADTRYAMLLGAFRASRLVDPYSPTAPTLIARRFDEGREISETEVKAMLEEILSSPLVPRVAALIGKRLSRPLEPFDIWYNGFRGQGKYSEAMLDSIVAAKYPTAQAYKDSIPGMLQKLGFSRDRALALADNIVVDAARGSGHAWGSAMRAAKAHLRTRVEKDGMNYKGYNIAVHEMGHNVEQTFSLNYVDHTLLQGVPNTAFTEAFAFVFQGHDLDLLGLKNDDPDAEALKTLNDFWGTYEIAGVALVDMAVWHWMYDHPDADAAELREATLMIAKDVWNKYYAAAFNKKDVPLLAVYSHMIDSFLYLPDYPIGHIIAYQIEAQMKKAGNIGSEFERMATYGNVAPDVWMKNATGSGISPRAMLAGTERAIETIAGKE